MSDGLELAVRLVLSLAFVVALMWVAARVVRGQIAGRSGGTVEVLARHQLGRGSSVAVLRVADQALVVGVTESRVTLLTEADLEVVLALTEGSSGTGRSGRGRSEPRTARTATAIDQNGRPVGFGSGSGSGSGSSTGALHGSIVSPSTWRQAVEALRDRTARKR